MKTRDCVRRQLRLSDLSRLEQRRVAKRETWRVFVLVRSYYCSLVPAFLYRIEKKKRRTEKGGEKKKKERCRSIHGHGDFIHLLSQITNTLCVFRQKHILWKAKLRQNSRTYQERKLSIDVKKKKSYSSKKKKKTKGGNNKKTESSSWNSLFFFLEEHAKKLLSLSCYTLIKCRAFK